MAKHIILAEYKGTQKMRFQASFRKELSTSLPEDTTSFGFVVTNCLFNLSTLGVGLCFNISVVTEPKTDVQHRPLMTCVAKELTQTRC